MYRELIIDLYKNPENKRAIADADLTNNGANLTCGDHVRIYVKLDEDTISDISFEGEGCAISIASASLLTNEAKGSKMGVVANWGAKEIFDWLGTELGPARIKCGLLALETLQGALQKNAK